jgi:hypothetical protein
LLNEPINNNNNNNNNNVSCSSGNRQPSDGCTGYHWNNFCTIISISTQTTNATTTTTTTTTVEDNATSLATRIQITKDATNSYAISEGSVRVGSFDTIYAITGSVDDISGNGDLIMSTIQNDFNSSSTVGYVMAKAANSNNTASNITQGTTALPSPFASSKEISQRIADEIQKGIEAAEHSDEMYMLK